MAEKLLDDYRDMLCLLNEEQVEYLLIGGWAISFHARFRYTEDIDLWVRPSPTNAAHLMRALRRFGAPLTNVTEADFIQPRYGLHIGVPPCRIDILTTIAGVSFDEAWPNRIEETLDGIPINVIGLDELIRNKQAAGRDRDLRDVAVLKKSSGKKPAE